MILKKKKCVCVQRYKEDQTITSIQKYPTLSIKSQKTCQGMTNSISPVVVDDAKIEKNERKH